MGVKEENDILYVICSSACLFGKAKECLLTRSEKDVVELYVLDNCTEVSYFVEYLSLSFSIRPFNKFK